MELSGIYRVNNNAGCRLNTAGSMMYPPGLAVFETVARAGLW
jgi:hypothetical protein